MDLKFCLSCAVPLDPVKNPSGKYCANCATPDGALKSRQEIEAGLTQWMKMWQPSLDNEKAVKRAQSYMNAMPAWALD